MARVPIVLTYAKGRNGVLRVALLACGILFVIAWGITFLWRGELKTAVSGGTFHKVAPSVLEVTIKRNADLQAVKNIDIQSPVEGQTTIQKIVKEGTWVKKDEIILELDSAEIGKKLQEAALATKRADADLVAAKEAKLIQDAKNLADTEAADVELTLAKLDLREYTDGKFPQLLREAKKGVAMAEIALKNKQEELTQMKALQAKGFTTAADLKKAELEVLTAENDLDKKTSELEVLKTYTYEKELTDKKNKLVQSERKVQRTRKENASNLSQKIADENAKESALAAAKKLEAHLQKQFDGCKVKAPSDGLVLYASSGQEYYYRERPIQAGVQVRQQELIVRLPDTSKMKANVKINESLIPQIRSDEKNKMTATINIVGQPKPVTGWVSSISILADNSQRWWNPDLKEYPVEVTLDETPAGLKPGTSASVVIAVKKLENVLTVPLSSIYSVSKNSYVFVKDGSQLKHALVKIGATNETHAEIAAGLKSGDEVLILQVGQGRELLERAGIKEAPSTQPSGPNPPGNGPKVALAR